MVFASALVSLLLAAAALAVPRPAAANQISNATSHVAFSTNWAGASLESPSGTYTSVTGTFTVPTPKSPGGSGSFAASAWVGIDGDTCSSAIMQTGIDFNIDNGVVSYDGHFLPWYEYYPAFASDFSGFSVSAGDVITLVATKSSTTSGSVSITNESTRRPCPSAHRSAPLCGQNAEWIVEDFEEGHSRVGWNRRTEWRAAARLEQNSVLTSVSATTSSVTVKYV
ncbi:unnamed protein product [Mycena citricolor]|uniref:Acid proteinase n=1 Tax=Mycena citricolor TaxID=2018698 RepID=A0AAD2H1N0_9AGAR|nr:unnamed protein product [Mycena citricolor]